MKGHIVEYSTNVGSALTKARLLKFDQEYVLLGKSEEDNTPAFQYFFPWSRIGTVLHCPQWCAVCLAMKSKEGA